MLRYTISKRRDSIEAYGLLALPLSSPLAATVRSVRLGYAWSKAAERVDQRQKTAYRNKSKLKDRSQRRPEWEAKHNNKTHTRKPRSRSVYRSYLPIAVIVLQLSRNPNQEHQQSSQTTKRVKSPNTKCPAAQAPCSIEFAETKVHLTVDCFTLGTSIISTTLMKNLLGAGRGRADRPEKKVP